LLRTVRGNRWVPRRRYGPGAGLRGNRWAPRHHHSGNRWVQRRNYPGAPGTSTRAVVSREEATVIRQEAASAPEIGAEEIAALTEIVTEQMVDAEYEDEASASNVSVDGDELMPLPPEFTVPPMEWLLGGPSAGWLVDDPERDFGDEELPAPPPSSLPTMYYCPLHGYGPRLPFSSPSAAVAVDTLPSGFDINLPLEVKMENIDGVAPALTLEMMFPEGMATAQSTEMNFGSVD
jgi:hypothetical protein